MLEEANFVDRVTSDLAAGHLLLLVLGEGIVWGKRMGAEVRSPGNEDAAAYAALAEERPAIDAEFAARGFDPADWIAGEVPVLRLVTPITAALE